MKLKIYRVAHGFVWQMTNQKKKEKIVSVIFSTRLEAKADANIRFNLNGSSK